MSTAYRTRVLPSQGIKKRWKSFLTRSSGRMLSSEPLLPSALTELKTWADISYPRVRSTLC